MYSYNSNSNYIGIGIFKREILGQNSFGLTCVKTNSAFNEVFSLNANEIKGRTMQDLMGNCCDYLDKICYKVLVEGQERNIETDKILTNKNLSINFINIDQDSILVQVFDSEKQNEHYKEVYKYKLLFDNSLDSMIIFKSTGEIMDCNRQALKEYGYLKNEMLNLKIYSLIKKNLKQHEEKHYSGKSSNLEEVHIRKDGSVFPVDVMYIEIGVSYGKLIFAQIRNITEEKRKNKEIQKLSIAVEQSSSSVIITDFFGVIEYVNQKFEKSTGYTREEVIGKTPDFMVSGFPNGKVYKQMWSTILNGEEWIGEFRGKTKEGNIFWWGSSISPVKDKNNTITNYLSVSEDITEKKELIYNLNKKNEELRETLKVLKTTQIKLLQEDKMATIGQLSAGIAHEINNPLGFVLSNLSTLKKYIYKFQDTLQAYRAFKDTISVEYPHQFENDLAYVKQAEEKNKISFIESDLDELFADTNEGVFRIRNIVNALRTFSHENSNEDKTEYDLNEGIKNTVVIARNETKYNSVVDINLSEIPIIIANGGEINQVLLNLIVNASHAIKEKMEKNSISNEDFGKIDIKTYNDEKYVYCSVEDNGIGIKKEYINKVIEPFFTTKPIGKGTGLGLSISYEIITNNHKGELIIDSVENKGTKIIIKLPINS